MVGDFNTIVYKLATIFTIFTIITMLDTFQQVFFQMVTSQGYFPKWELPKSSIYQAATSQVCSSRHARPPPILAPLQHTALQRASLI